LGLLDGVHTSAKLRLVVPALRRQLLLVRSETPVRLDRSVVFCGSMLLNSLRSHSRD